MILIYTGSPNLLAVWMQQDFLFVSKLWYYQNRSGFLALETPLGFTRAYKNTIFQKYDIQMGRKQRN